MTEGEDMPIDQEPIPTATKTPSGGAQDPKLWFDAATPGIEAWTQSSTALLTGLRGMADSMQLFSQSRLQANIDTCKSLLSCRDPAALVALQRDYVETATTQYSQHAQDISKQTSAMIAAVTKHQPPET